jgi:ribosome biogenesis GTPase
MSGRPKEAVDLAVLGLNPRWEALFAPHRDAGLALARVVRTDRGSALVALESGIVRARPSVRLLRAAAGPADLPVVGDWVALLAREELETPLVEAVLERAGAITRGGPGRGSEVQVLAANIDRVFVVHPIAEGPNLRRIERELALAWDSGAVPVVVLTKADLSPDPEEARALVEGAAVGVEVLAMNAPAGVGVGAVLERLPRGHTAVLIGPSGAGKSTLVNALLGEARQATREVRVADGRGRHTTVARELVSLPGGGLLIDTPGLRALALTGSDEGIAAVFPEIEALAEACRFRDCAHGDEPGCAVRAAVEAGGLDAARLESNHKLLRESAVAAARTDSRLKAEEERKWKIIHKAAKRLYKHRDKK